MLSNQISLTGPLEALNGVKISVIPVITLQWRPIVLSVQPQGSDIKFVRTSLVIQSTSFTVLYVPDTFNKVLGPLTIGNKDVLSTSLT